MKIKAILFDIDGVVIKGNTKKHKLIFDIIKKHNLDKISGVSEILKSGFNRRILLEKIYKLHKFDLDLVLNEINQELSKLENNVTGNDMVIKFIKNNKDTIIFATNTSLPKKSLNIILKQVGLEKSFNEFLTYETGSKKENTEFFIKKYNLKPEEVLFIDDKIKHIERVEPTKVNLLHYTNYNIDISEIIFKN